MPAYNAGRFIREAIDSILSQTYPNLELIVVNNGSTDETLDIVQSYGDRLFCCSREQRGIAPARNMGVEKSSGDFLGFMDADDIAHERRFEIEMQKFIENPSLDMVFAHMTNFHDGVSNSDRDPIPGVVPGSLLIRRDSFFRVGFFEAGPKAAEFVEWLIHARSLDLRETICPEVLLRRRVHSDNIGVREKAEIQQSYVRQIKAALDRRRSAEGYD